MPNQTQLNSAAGSQASLHDGLLDQLLVQAAPQAAAGSAGIVRGCIAEMLADGRVSVRLAGPSGSLIRCDFLQSALASAPDLAEGDDVLVLLSQEDDGSGCVLGRVVLRRLPPAQPLPSPNVVVEAAESLSLKCGESKIELRKDGKILIKGKDLVSHAERTNRIKGGSVAIN